MSSEQQERMAVQYAERSLLFTVKSLLKILEWSRRKALAQDSAYKIGVQKLEELLQSPYSIDTINLKKDLGTIYQFTPPTTYCIYENIKKGGFQTEIVF